MICLCFFHFVKKCGLTLLKEGSLLPSRFWPLAQRHRCHHREVALCGNYFLPGGCLFALRPLPPPHHPSQPSCLTHLCMLCVDRGTCGLSEATWERILPQGYKVPFRSIKATLEKYPKPPETYAGSEPHHPPTVGLQRHLSQHLNGQWAQPSLIHGWVLLATIEIGWPSPPSRTST